MGPSICIHKRHPILHLGGQVLQCRIWVFWSKDRAVKRLGHITKICHHDKPTIQVWIEMTFISLLYHIRVKTVSISPLTSSSLEGPPSYVHVSKSTFYSHEAPMGKWSWCCTPTGKDGSKEHDLGWISRVVAEFRHLQDSRSPYHAYRYTNDATMG